MKRFCDLNYAIVGLGLMGGSFGKALRLKVLDKEGSTGKIFGSDKNASALQAACDEHIIDREFPISEVDKMLLDSDVVFICLYPAATVDFLISHRDFFKANSIVTDISGVKAELFAHLQEIVRDDVSFIPGHPMAGGEKEGFFYSSAKIFEGRNYILMPLENTDSQKLETFKRLIETLGFKRIVQTEASVHDHKIAFTSQLCHVIASALVDSAEDAEVTAFGGGSFEDLTRIALINAPLWTELFLANKKELLLHIGRFESSLEKFRTLLENSDGSALQETLESVRQKRADMSRLDISS